MPGALNTEVLLSLQRSHGNRIVQRLLQPPSGATTTRTAQRLRSTDNAVVDIDALDYEQLHYYQTLYNERQIEKTAHANIFDNEEDDIRRIKKRLAELEPLAPEVRCGEGETKVAQPNQKVDFGGVTSCMTFTCVLQDGTKVLSHEAVKNRSHALAAIPDLMREKELTSPITQIFAIGVGGTWTYAMDVVTPDTKDAMVLNNLGEFERTVKAALQAASAQFTFKDHAAGSVKMTAEGNPLAAQIGKEVSNYLGDNEYYEPQSCPYEALALHLASELHIDAETAAAELDNYLVANGDMAGFVAKKK